MPAMGKVQPHDPVARLQQRQKHRLIGLRAGMGLHIDKARAEQLLRAVDSDLFHHIDMLAPAVIAFAGVTFGIFVGQNRPLGAQHIKAHNVFRCDQLDLVHLAIKLASDCLGNGAVGDLVRAKGFQHDKGPFRQKRGGSAQKAR